MAAFPKSAKIATGCDYGYIRVYDLNSDGDALIELPAHVTQRHGPGCDSGSVTGLAVLDDQVLASVSDRDGKLQTWDAMTGERLDCMDFSKRSTSIAFAAFGPETLVAGVESGDLIFLKHTCGRQLTEVACLPSEDEYGEIVAVAGHDNVVVTANQRADARIWSLSARKPLKVLDLGGRQRRATCTAINSRYIAICPGWAS